MILIRKSSIENRKLNKDCLMAIIQTLAACRKGNHRCKVEAASSRFNKRQDGASTLFSDRHFARFMATPQRFHKSITHGTI
jgi:hypothetical protein